MLKLTPFSAREIPVLNQIFGPYQEFYRDTNNNIYYKESDNDGNHATYYQIIRIIETRRLSADVRSFLKLDESNPYNEDDIEIVESPIKYPNIS